MATEPTTLKCPICKKPVALTDENMPFCSERCRTIDLARWASGEYKISSPILDPEVLEGLQHGIQRKPDDEDE